MHCFLDVIVIVMNGMKEAEEVRERVRIRRRR